MLHGTAAYRKAYSILKHHRLLWFMWFPAALTLLVFWGGWSLTDLVTKEISDSLDTWVEGLIWLPEWASAIRGVIYFIIWLFMRIILYFAFTFLGGSIILLLMAPVLTWLSERAAIALGEQAAVFSATQFMRDLTRAAGLAIRNGFIQLLLTIACFFVGLIPLVGVIAPFLLLFINAYFYGYNFLDYSLERRRLSMAESNRFVWKYKASTLGVGMPFALWMLIPLLGPLTAGFAAVLATVAGTVEINRLSDARTFGRTA